MGAVTGVDLSQAWFGIQIVKIVCANQNRPGLGLETLYWSGRRHCVLEAPPLLVGLPASLERFNNQWGALGVQGTGVPASGIFFTGQTIVMEH